MQLRHGLWAVVCAVFVIGCVSQRDQGLELERCAGTDETVAQGGHSFIQHPRQRQVLHSIAWLHHGDAPHRRVSELDHENRRHTETPHRNHAESIKALHTDENRRHAVAPHSRGLDYDNRRHAAHGERAGDDRTVSRKEHSQTSKHMQSSQVVFNFLLVIVALVAIFLGARQLLKKNDEAREQKSGKESSVEGLVEEGLGAKQEHVQATPVVEGQDKEAEPGMIVDEATAVARTPKDSTPKDLTRALKKNHEEQEQQCGKGTSVEGLVEEGLGPKQEHVQAVPIVEGLDKKAEPDMMVDEATAVARTPKDSMRKSKKASKDKSGKKKTADQAENLAQSPQSSHSLLSEAPSHQNDVPVPDPEVTGPEDADGTGSTEVLEAPSLLLSVGPDFSEASAIEDRFEVDLSPRVSDKREVSVDGPLIAEEPECVAPIAILPLADRSDALKELNELKARQEVQDKLEEEQRAAVASVEKLEADQAKMGEEEDAAEKAFKLLPYKARTGAATTIGKEFWVGSSWRARLAAAQELAQESATQSRSKASRKARSKKNAASNQDAAVDAGQPSVQV